MSPDVPSLAWVAELLLSNSLLILLAFTFLTGISLFLGFIQIRRQSTDRGFCSCLLPSGWFLADTSDWFAPPPKGCLFHLQMRQFRCVLRLGRLALLKEI